MLPFANRGRLLLVWALIMSLHGISGATAEAWATESDPYGKIVKEIRFEGLKRTREYIVQRELLTQVGEPCLSENIAQEHQRLDNLDIFSRVEINPTAVGDSVVVTYSFV